MELLVINSGGFKIKLNNLISFATIAIISHLTLDEMQANKYMAFVLTRSYTTIIESKFSHQCEINLRHRVNQQLGAPIVQSCRLEYAAITK